MPFDVQLFTDRLEKGASLSGVKLSPGQLRLMAGHARELSLWNKKINLTAIRGTAAMAEKHFVDTVCACPLMDDCSPWTGRIMDMGTGGGFPAIPLKILNPGMAVTMVDSVRKKVNFLNHVVRTLGLENIAAVHDRVEELAKNEGHANGYDAVISRGFADLEKFVALARPMLRPGGVIYAMKGEHAPAEITPGLENTFEIITRRYKLPFDGAERYLLCLKEK
ncbi:MAG: 16S rRNA (guanine(527)-N(7))-methyltransferase RsmG [Desulfobacter sp.]|nr:MAG: 16S rRNA (guanine(527)-N(7))-methyltransferase RsmG [Desulfobacter sp.]